jgi:NAD-dependent dihydropyrimidine dehydrogenase PreA subunit
VFASHGVQITPSDCIQCHLCADTCPYEAIEPATETSPNFSNRKRVVGLLALAPLLVATGVFAGIKLAPTFASLDSRVILARGLMRETLDPSIKKTLATDAFSRHGFDKDKAYYEANQVERDFALGTPILGGWLGFVIVARGVLAGRRRQNRDYVASTADCYHCARCLGACPVPETGRFAHLQNLLGGSS